MSKKHEYTKAQLAQMRQALRDTLEGIAAYCRHFESGDWTGTDASWALCVEIPEMCSVALRETATEEPAAVAEGNEFPF